MACFSWCADMIRWLWRALPSWNIWPANQHPRRDLSRLQVSKRLAASADALYFTLTVDLHCKLISIYIAELNITCTPYRLLAEPFERSRPSGSVQKSDQIAETGNRYALGTPGSFSCQATFPDSALFSASLQRNRPCELFSVVFNIKGDVNRIYSLLNLYQ